MPSGATTSDSSFRQPAGRRGTGPPHGATPTTLARYTHALREEIEHAREQLDRDLAKRQHMQAGGQ